MANGNQFSTGLSFGLPELGLSQDEQQPLVDPTVQLTTRPSQTLVTPDQIELAQRNLEADQAKNAEQRAARNQKISGILSAISAGLAAYSGNQQLASQILSQQSGAKQARAERAFAERQAERQEQNQKELVKMRARIEKDLAKMSQRGSAKLQKEQQVFLAGENKKDREIRKTEGKLSRDLEERRIQISVDTLNAESGFRRQDLKLRGAEAAQSRADRHLEVFLSRNIPMDEALTLSQVTSGMIGMGDLDPATRKSVELRLSTTMAKSPGEAQTVFLNRMNEQMVLLGDPTQRNTARASIASGVDFAQRQIELGNPNFVGMEPTIDFIRGQAQLNEATRNLDPSVGDTADDTRSILTLGGTRPLPRTDNEYSALPAGQQKQYERGLEVEAEKAAEAGIKPEELAPIMLRLGIPQDSTVLKDTYTRSYQRRVKEIDLENRINRIQTKQRRGEQLTNEEVELLLQEGAMGGPATTF